MNISEIESHERYLGGDENSIEWIPKALKQRELLLKKGIKCPQCNAWVNLGERICVCTNNHNCNSYVVSSVLPSFL